MSGGRKGALYVMAALLVCLSVFCSFFFIAENADHDCTHDDSCEICQLIEASADMLRTKTLAPSAPAVIALFSALAAAAVMCCVSFHFTQTLISLKTELRN